MKAPHVVMLSLWRNDANRRLEERVAHLLDRSYRALRWLWVVGDSSDDTEERLRAAVPMRLRDYVQIVQHDTGIIGEEPDARLRRLSATANAWWQHLRPYDDLCLLHESDIESPSDLIERMLGAGVLPLAGWPTLGAHEGAIFYDTWAYRRDGVQFINTPPYHACYRPDELFEVDSVGTVWMFYANDIRAGVRCYEAGALDLCAQMKTRGRRFWVDPSLRVVQPLDLWVVHRMPKVEAVA